MRRLAPALLLLAACATPRQPLLVGQSVDDFSLPTLDGGTLSLDELRGSVVLLDVWASWCAPCVQSMPFYADLENALGPRGFRFVGVNVDEDQRRARGFLENESLELTTLLDPGARTVERLFDIRRLPKALLFDREGRVRYVHEGFTSADKTTFRRRVEELLAEK